MMFKHLISLVLVAIAAFGFPLPGLAAGNQSNQSMNQPAALIAPEPDVKVGVYPKPGTDKQQVGYGEGGDRVTIVEQVGSNEGVTWDYVRFEKAPQLEGWIQSSFISMESDFSAQDTFSQQDQQPDRQQDQQQDRQQDQSRSLISAAQDSSQTMQRQSAQSGQDYATKQNSSSKSAQSTYKPQQQGGYSQQSGYSQKQKESQTGMTDIKQKMIGIKQKVMDAFKS